MASSEEKRSIHIVSSASDSPSSTKHHSHDLLTDLERNNLSVENVEVSSRVSRNISNALTHFYGGDETTHQETEICKQHPPIGLNKPFPTHIPEREPYTVSFNGPSDPIHPHNWPLRKKLIMCFIMGYNTAAIAFASSIFSTIIGEISHKFRVGTVVASLGVSLYVLGFATGPVIWAPLSELFGRKIVLILSILGFTIFQFACATAEDLQTVMISRAFGGIFGSAPLVVVPAAFADIFDGIQRGIAVPLFTANVFSMPLVSPIIGAFIVNSTTLDWRWTQYISGIIGCFGLVLLFFLEETHHPIVLVKKAKEIKERTGNWLIHAPHQEFELSVKDIIEKTLTRPFLMIIREPIILLISIYTAFIYGILYMLLTAYPMIFAGGYKMQGGVAFLPYLSLVVGMLFACAWCVYLNGKYLKAVEKNDGKPVPEARLHPAFAGSIAFPIGLLWLTWTGNYPEKIHWIVPTLAGMFIGFGLLTIFNATISYIIDSYLIFAASALAANTFLRSGAACAFPLFSPIMFKNMGTNWAGLLLGCAGISLIPVPVLFFIYGKRIRTKSKWAIVL